MISVRGLAKRFTTEQGDVRAVDGVTFQAQAGEFYTLLGPSGCGKTTTLQCIAGLETPDDGEIELGGTLVYSRGRGINLPAHARDFGMVFQSYAIWPHMTVFDNVAYPLVHGRRKTSRVKVRERVMNALARVQLDALTNRPAPFLSGGQQQRVAVARALVDEPKVLLLDEPLSNLDAKLREEMRVELRQLVKRLNITTLYVTHDQIEALSMSDRVAVMSKGRIVQEGTPKEVYLAPRHPFVANFVGKINLIQAQIRGNHGNGRAPVLETTLGELRCAAPIDLPEGARLLLAIRPEGIVVGSAQHSFEARLNVLEGTIGLLSFYGDYVECQVEVEGQTLTVRADPYVELRAGDRVRLAIAPERIMVIPDAAEAPEHAREHASQGVPA